MQVLSVVDLNFLHQMEHPILLQKSIMSRLWFKSDFTFQTPKAYIRIHFNFPESNGSPEAVVLSALFCRLLLDYLNEHGIARSEKVFDAVIIILVVFIKSVNGLSLCQIFLQHTMLKLLALVTMCSKQHKASR